MVASSSPIASASGPAHTPLALPDAGHVGGRPDEERAEGSEEDAGDGEPNEDASDFFDGRPDLSQNALENLRAQHQRLKEQQKLVRKNMKNQTRMRSRIIKRMRHLDTASVLQVLVERGVNFGSLKGAAGVAAAATAVANAQTARAASSAAPAPSSR